MRTDKLDEFSLIKKLTGKLPVSSKNIVKGIGDDAAVIKISKNKYFLTTCDALVEDVHFLKEMAKPEQVGKKAVAVNISDIAAMGGKPTFCLVSLIIPKGRHPGVATTTIGSPKDSIASLQNDNSSRQARTINTDYIDRLYSGIIKECEKYNIQIIGGNISSGNQLVIDLFMLGKVNPDHLILRSDAKPGDKVLVTGNLGEAAAKLLINKQHNPTPRLKESTIIAKSGMATAMIDISDGLSSDVLHICEQSKVGVRIYEKLLPIATSASLEQALNGGEDYELLFTAPPLAADKIIKEVLQKTGTKVTVIGEILPQKSGRWLILKNGKEVPLKARGWNHLL